jgi:predicted TIM-barrel fold metal-dependent hydrolase
MKKSQQEGMDRRTFLKMSSAVGLGAAAIVGVPGVASAQAEKNASAKEYGEKIDAYSHILPKKYKEAIFEKMPKTSYYFEADSTRPALFDLDVRFRGMDKVPGLKQVLTPGAPPLEYVASPRDAVDMARMANDEMAELVGKYPDRFVAAVACLPLNDVNASIREAERAIKDLKFKGIQMFTSINGKPLDSPEFLGLYEKMAQYDLPIWIHPAKDRNIPDYPGEAESKYALFLAFAWPYETTLAMSRLVFSGIMEKYPNLKCITHHCGGMLPAFYKRVALIPPGMKTGDIQKLTKPPLEYFKRFYADTVMGGNIPALMAGYDFFGADQMLFASDYPYPGGAQQGEAAMIAVIKSVEQMPVGDADKIKMFSKNTRRILKLA